MNAHLRDEVTVWDTKVEARRSEVLRLERAKVAGNVESTKLQGRLQHLKQLDREMAAQQGRLQQIVAQQQERLTREKGKHRAQQHTLRQALEQASQQLDERKADCTRLATAVAEAKQQLAAMPEVWRGEILAVKQELTAVQQARTAAEEEHAHLHAEVQQQCGLLHLQTTEHETQVQREQQQVQEHRRALAQHQDETETLRRQHAKEAHELEALAQQVATWQATAQERDATREQAQMAAEEAEQQLAHERAAQQAGAQQAEALREQQRELEQQLTALQQQAAEYRVRADTATAALARLEAMPVPAAPTAAETHDMEQKQAAVQALQLQNHELLRSNADKVEQLSALEKQHADLQRSAEKERHLQEAMATELQRQQIRLEQLQAEQAELSAWYDKRDSLCQAAQQDVQQARAEQQRLQQAQQLLGARVDGMHSRNVRMRQLCQVQSTPHAAPARPERYAQRLFLQLAAEPPARPGEHPA